MRITRAAAPRVPLLDHRSALPLDMPFTPRMAEAWGVSRAQLRAHVEQGLVRRVLRGVYAVAQAPDDIHLRAGALGLVVPRSAIVTDRTAAWLHGVPILPRTALRSTPPIQVFQSSGTRVRRPGVLSGTRGLLESDVTEVDGVRATTALRTALDLGRLLWRFDALAAIDGFLRIGVQHEELLQQISRFKGYRGVRQLRALAPLGDRRSESPGESGLRLHWHDAGLPAPELQLWVYDDHGVAVYRLDLTLPELRYAAEYDGERFHSASDDVEHDGDRRKWLRNHARWEIDVFTKVDVYSPNSDPVTRLLAGIERARKALHFWTPGLPGNHE